MPPTGEGFQWQENQHKLSIFLFLKTFKLPSIVCGDISVSSMCYAKCCDYKQAEVLHY